MADEIHQQMREDNSTRLRTIVSTLAVIYVVTFLSGFLQDTQYNFVNYVLFALLFIGDCQINANRNDKGIPDSDGSLHNAATHFLHRL